MLEGSNAKTLKDSMLSRCVIPTNFLQAALMGLGSWPLILIFIGSLRRLLSANMTCLEKRPEGFKNYGVETHCPKNVFNTNGGSHVMLC